MLKFENAEVSVIRSKRKTISVEIRANQVTVRSPLRMSEKDIEKFVESKRNWIIKHLKLAAEKQKALGDIEPFTENEIKGFVAKAKEVIPPKVEAYAKKIGVTYNRITIRCQRTRWGSCSSNGNLNFNCLLVLLPDEVIDSVIVHELCHRKYMNHSVNFYAELSKYFPDFKRCDKWLKENGNKLIRRIPK